jgi:hypothetical protein
MQGLVPLDGLEDAADHLLDESLQPGAVLLDDRLLGSGNGRRLCNDGVPLPLDRTGPGLLSLNGPLLGKKKKVPSSK